MIKINEFQLHPLLLANSVVILMGCCSFHNVGGVCICDLRGSWEPSILFLVWLFYFRVDVTQDVLYFRFVSSYCWSFYLKKISNNMEGRRMMSVSSFSFSGYDA